MLSGDEGGAGARSQACDLCVHVMDGIGNSSALLGSLSGSRGMSSFAPSPQSPALSVAVEIVGGPEGAASVSASSARTRPCRNARQLFWDEHIVIAIPHAAALLHAPDCLVRVVLIATNAGSGQQQEMAEEEVALYQKPARDFLRMYFNNRGDLVLPSDGDIARHECIVPLITASNVGAVTTPSAPLLQTLRLRMGVALVRADGPGLKSASMPPPTQSCTLSTQLYELLSSYLHLYVTNFFLPFHSTLCAFLC